MSWHVLPDPHAPGRHVRLIIARQARAAGDVLWVSCGGMTWRQDDGPPAADADVKPLDGQALTPAAYENGDARNDFTQDALVSPMAARVVAVLVAPGQRVNAGQEAVVLEAMKCEQRLVVPAHVRITEVLCEAGEQVQDEQVLVRWVALDEGEAI